ncbi:unnamed protein product, partial [Phaeothamnion confervicola]
GAYFLGSGSSSELSLVAVPSDSLVCVRAHQYRTPVPGGRLSDQFPFCRIFVLMLCRSFDPTPIPGLGHCHRRGTRRNPLPAPFSTCCARSYASYFVLSFFSYVTPSSFHPSAGLSAAARRRHGPRRDG